MSSFYRDFPPHTRTPQRSSVMLNPNQDVLGSMRQSAQQMSSGSGMAMGSGTTTLDQLEAERQSLLSQLSQTPRESPSYQGLLKRYEGVVEQIRAIRASQNPSAGAGTPTSGNEPKETPILADPGTPGSILQGPPAPPPTPAAAPQAPTPSGPAAFGSAAAATPTPASAAAPAATSAPAQTAADPCAALDDELFKLSMQYQTLKSQGFGNNLQGQQALNAMGERVRFIAQAKAECARRSYYDARRQRGEELAARRRVGPPIVRMPAPGTPGSTLQGPPAPPGGGNPLGNPPPPSQAQTTTPTPSQVPYYLEAPPEQVEMDNYNVYLQALLNGEITREEFDALTGN